MRIKLKHALIDFKFGILNGFPLCCVINYSFDTLMFRDNQKLNRHIIDLGHNGYAPCRLCLRAHKQTHLHAVLELALETGIFDDKDYWLLPKRVRDLVFNPPRV